MLALLLEIFRTAADGTEGFIFEQQRYTSRGPDGVVKSSTFEWTPEVLDDLAAVHQAPRDPAAIQSLGTRMYRFAERMHWSELAPHVREAVDQRCNVEITIRTAASELYALPWELLTTGASGQHIGELSGVLLRYEWPGTRTATPASPTRTGLGRLLFAYSGHVRAADHIEAIEQAWNSHGHSFARDRDVLGHVSLDQLDKALLAATNDHDPVNVLHLLCHGAPVGSTYGLALHEDELGSIATVDAGRLRQILVRHAATLRLVILSACNSGNAGRPGNAMGSVAQALHRAGIAAVVASRYPLSRDGALAFTTKFYSKLAATCDVNEAFLAARTQVANDPRQLDWASLQLYARGDRDHRSQGAPAIEVLSDFQTIFRGTQERVALLKEYKELHDQLQTLEVPFSVILYAQKHLLTSRAAWNELVDPLASLQDHIARVLDKVNSESLREQFEPCRHRLTKAAGLLHSALNGKSEALHDALRCIHRVLSTDISSANHQLVGAARNVHLDVTVEELRAVLDRLGRNKLPDKAIGELTRLVTELGKLHEPLDALVREHDQWQQIGNEVRPFIGNDQYDVDHARLSWEFVLASLERVLQPELRADWTQPVDTELRKQKSRLTQSANASDYIACLRSVWRPCNQRFIAVDKLLLETCRELGSVGSQFDTVFRMGA